MFTCNFSTPYHCYSILIILGKNLELLKLITSSVTDNASDAKKWAKTIAKYSSNEAEFNLFFCNLHKLGIGSRDCAVVVKAFITSTSFQQAKAGQGRFDDFNADFYSTYSKLHHRLPMDEVNADTVKATAIRFLTFDRNVCVTFPIYENIIAKLEEKKERLERMGEKLEEDSEAILRRMKIPLYRFVAWALAVLYAKFHYPYLKMMKSSKSNVSFNHELVSEIFPKLIEATTTPDAFFDRNFEIFEKRPIKSKYAIMPRPSTAEIDAKFDLNGFLVQLLTELFNALKRNSTDFCEGGKFAALTEEQRGGFDHIPVTTIQVEESFGRYGYNIQRMPNATVNYNSALQKLAQAKFSIGSALQLREEIGEVHVTNFFSFLALEDSAKQKNKENERLQREEDDKQLEELLKKRVEKERKADAKESVKMRTEWVEKEKLDDSMVATDLKIQCQKHNLPVSGNKQALIDRLLLHIR